MSQGDVKTGISPDGRCLPVLPSAGGGLPPDIMVSVAAAARPAQSPIADRTFDAASLSRYRMEQMQPKDSVFYGNQGRSPMTPFRMPLGSCGENQPFKTRTTSTTDAGERNPEDDVDRHSRRASTGSISGGLRNGESVRQSQTSNHKHKKTDRQVAVLKEYFEIDDKPSSHLIDQISRDANLTAKEVRNWFRNRRCRCPKQSRIQPFSLRQPGSEFLSLDSMQRSPSAEADGGLWGANTGLLTHMQEKPFISLSPHEVLAISGRIPPNSPPLFESGLPTELPVMQPHSAELQQTCLQQPADLQQGAHLQGPIWDQQQCYSIMKGRVLREFDRWREGSQERKDMLSGLVSILGFNEKHHLINEIESQLPYQHPLMFELGCKKADRAWKELERIFHTRVYGQSDDSGQGSDASLSSHGPADMYGRSAPKKKSSDTSVLSTGSQSCLSMLENNPTEQCNQAMVKGLANMFKNRHEYLEAVCRELKYQLTPQSGLQNEVETPNPMSGEAANWPWPGISSRVNTQQGPFGEQLLGQDELPMDLDPEFLQYIGGGN